MDYYINILVGLILGCILFLCILLYCLRSCRRKGRKAVDDDIYSHMTPEDCRKAAVENRKVRDKCFQLANDYMRNRPDGQASAEFYEEQAKWHDVRYKEANKRAAEKFLVKNSAGKPEHFIDLHSLYVDEAIEAVKEKLEKFATAPKVVIITGRGLHSQNGARIKPAVENFLIDNTYRFEEQFRNPGALVVNMRRMEPSLRV